MAKKQIKKDQEAKRPGQIQAKPPVKATGDMGVLKELLELLDGSSAMTIKLSRGEASYEVSRGPTGFVASPMTIHTHPSPSASGAPASPAAAGSPAAVPSVTSAPPSNLVEIKSPMVGTFYRAPEPGADPYVKPGSRVSVGQTLCIIEAMKMMNEIESQASGRVVKILCDNAQPIEYGQPLMIIEIG